MLLHEITRKLEFKKSFWFVCFYVHQFPNTRVELKPIFIECFKKKYKNFKLLAANAQSNKKKEAIVVINK